MARRLGILGIGTLLSVAVAGCVTTGVTPESPRVDALVTAQPPRPLLAGPPLLPSVTEAEAPERRLVVEPSKVPPPPEPDIQTVTLPPPPLPQLPTDRVARAPVEISDTPLLVAMRCVIDKQPSDAFEALQKYDKRTQEVLLAMLPLAARVSEGGLDRASPQELSAMLEQLNQATSALRARMPLSVEKVCYCRRITNYGMYDPLPEDRAFTGGSDKRPGELVQLYVEVRNFANRHNGKFYDTSLASKLEIHDPRGELVARMDFPAQADRSLSPRQDYFIHYQFQVPAKIASGEYVLTVTLQDENASGDETPRTTRKSLPFHVTGAATARAARSGNTGPR